MSDEVKLIELLHTIANEKVSRGGAILLGIVGWGVIESILFLYNLMVVGI